MYMVDFSYADMRLSDFGYMISYINTSNDTDVSLGNEIVFETIKNKSTNTNHIVNVTYNDPSSVTFDICKDPSKNEDLTFTDHEISSVMRWLNKKKYEKFCPIYDDISYPEIYFNGSFNISAIKINGDIVGFTLTFTPNAPYGFDSEKTVYYSLNEHDAFEFYNNSDEYGYLYPTRFEIICNKDGDFEMVNAMDLRNTVKINKCKNGETIVFDCQNKIIQTSNNLHPSICKDFNYNFPRFISNEYGNKNVFTVSMPCKIAITYSLIRKAGIIV